MKTLSLTELKNQTVRFTVKATNGRTGTLTYPDFDGKSPIGETHQVMFTDEIGNKMGFYGEISEIIKTEIYEWEFKEIELS